MPQLASTMTGPILIAPVNDQVFAEVCARLAPYNRADVDLRPTTTISADMDVDSLSVFDVIMEIEDVYEIAFPMEAISDMKTIGDLVEAIATLRAAA